MPYNWTLPGSTCFGFFVPTSGVDGKTAIVEGELFLDTISVEMLKHYAEDAGKSADEIALITEPSYDVNFIADGVIIKNWKKPFTYLAYFLFGIVSVSSVSPSSGISVIVIYF